MTGEADGSLTSTSVLPEPWVVDPPIRNAAIAFRGPAPALERLVQSPALERSRAKATRCRQSYLPNRRRRRWKARMARRKSSLRNSGQFTSEKYRDRKSVV